MDRCAHPKYKSSTTSRKLAFISLWYCSARSSLIPCSEKRSAQSVATFFNVVLKAAPSLSRFCGTNEMYQFARDPDRRCADRRSRCCKLERTPSGYESRKISLCFGSSTPSSSRCLHQRRGLVGLRTKWPSLAIPLVPRFQPSC
jgi:hypothetical protein